MTLYTLLPLRDMPGSSLVVAMPPRRSYKRPQTLLALTGIVIASSLLLIRISMALSGKITSSYPPTYERLWEYERRLPQHDPQLPLPEGQHGRYVRFANQVRQKGWNNILNEMYELAHPPRLQALVDASCRLLCTEVARQAKRAYVFEHFTWLVRYRDPLRGQQPLTVIFRTAQALPV